MKWENKGHEFCEAAVKLSDRWKISQSIYIFGAGVRGNHYRKLLEKYNIFDGFIDNDSDKQSDHVFALDEFFRQKESGWIILCAGRDYRMEMKCQLDKINVDYKKYFIYDMEEFFEKAFPVLSSYVLGKAFDNLCQISVTERCTLKCEKCAHGCWAVPMDRNDLSLEEVVKSADSYFNAFDYVVEFVLIGGEPFLYKHLAESIRYIGKHYRKQMMTFAITTNGTMIPSKEIIDACKKYDVHIHISNYAKTLPALKEHYEKLCLMLGEYKISYDLSNEDDKWVDYGFDSLVRGEEKDLQEVFDNCKTPCREVRGNKYYFCVQARAAGENMSFDVEDDYFDLSQIKSKEDKKALMEFSMGYSEKGYLDMCKYCYGAEANQRIIPRAVQKRDL